MATVTTTKRDLEVNITLNEEEIGLLHLLLANTGKSALDDLFERLYDIKNEFSARGSWRWNGDCMVYDNS